MKIGGIIIIKMRALISTTLIAISLIFAQQQADSVGFYVKIGDPSPNFELTFPNGDSTSFPELKGKGLSCMTESNDGSIWFGVTNGVIQYDGLNWTHYSGKNGFIDAKIHLNNART